MPKFLIFNILIIVSLVFQTCQTESAPTAEARLKLPAPKPKAPSPADTLLAEYDKWFEQEMAISGTPGAAVVVVRDSQIVFCKGYGVRAQGAGEAVDGNTVFRVGSLSKGFAGVLTGILVEEQKLAWDDFVVKHFPSFSLKDKAQAQRIRLTHLLSHTTGLPYHAYTNLIEVGFELRKMAEYFPRTKVYGKEGTVFAYQNVAFSLIEEVMRAAAGQTYHDLLFEKIFTPAGMRSASCTYETLQATENHAFPHLFSGYGWVETQVSPTYYNAAAAGGVNASAHDMGQWLQVLLGNRPDIVSEKTLDFVFAPRIRTYGERGRFRAWSGEKEAHYALGWRVLKMGTDTLVFHGGYVNGFVGQIAFDRKRKIGICALFNASTPLSESCLPEFFERLTARHEKGL